MARPPGFRRFFCAMIGVVWVLSGRASLAEPLLLITDVNLSSPGEHLDDDRPGYPVELVKQVLAAMGQDVSLEAFPTSRAWKMVLRGEADGMLAVSRSTEREQVCSFPDEPLTYTRYVLFVRTTDIGTLKFSSFDDLVGHDVAVHEPAPGLFEQPTVSPEMWQFLREHHNMVETNSLEESLRMVAAGHLDYAVVSLIAGKRAIARMGLTGKIEPLLSKDVMQENIYTCFGKARVTPSFVDGFSSALKKFKQTDAFQAIRRKYSLGVLRP